MAETLNEGNNPAIEIQKYDLAGKKVSRIYDFSSSRHGRFPLSKQVNHVEQLKKCLEGLDFEVQIIKDLDDDGMKDDLKKVAEGTDELACIWIFMITVSIDKFFRCADGCIRLEDLWENFTGDKCKILFGKPKMFFIQADDEKKDHRFMPLMNMVSRKPPEDKIVKALPKSSDIMLATFRRSEQDDFSMGRFLFEELNKGGSRNMNTIMTSIIGKRWTSTPTFSSTFCKQLYLSHVTQSPTCDPLTTAIPTLEKYNLSGKRLAYSFVFKDFAFLYSLPGAQADKDAIKKSMEAKGFTYEDCNKDWRLTKDDLKKKIREIAKNKDNADCVIIFVSTHGASGHKLYAYDDQFTTYDLWSPFTEYDGYKGKPKIFIIDGCRGVKGEQKAEKKVYFTKGVEQQNEKILEISDIIIGQSTLNEDELPLQTDNGSSYTQYLCKKLIDQKSECNLLDLLVSANHYTVSKIDEEAGNEHGGQMPTFTASLRKDICL